MSLTSHRNRIRTVHLAVEPIAHGTVRPRRLVLWLEDAGVVAHRVHRIRVRAGRILPYATRVPGAPAEASPRTFATGTSGVLHPPHLLDALREAGTGFTACAPMAHDVWLHAVALRHGTGSRPVGDGCTTYRPLPRLAFQGLKTTDVLRGSNDMRITATYSRSDVEELERAQEAEGP